MCYNISIHTAVAAAAAAAAVRQFYLYRKITPFSLPLPVLPLLCLLSQQQQQQLGSVFLTTSINYWRFSYFKFHLHSCGAARAPAEASVGVSGVEEAAPLVAALPPAACSVAPETLG